MLLNNRFEMGNEIGRGGIGIVHRAVDTKDNRRPVVVKVLLEHPDKKIQTWIRKHFAQEAEALKRIQHPGVVQFVDCGVTEEGKPFLAMEFIDGCDLRSQIDPHRGLVGDFTRTAAIIRQLGAALGATHREGVYHRDLKPENILLQTPRLPEEAEQVKVIDFGIATVKDKYDEATKTTQLFAGSRLYMAPEQIENKPTAASDIYALGVIAYEMLTGRKPFMPDMENPIAGMMQLMRMQQAGVKVNPKDLRPSLPEQAEKVILKALAYNPRDRYQQAEDFGNDLAEALVKEAEPAMSAWLETLPPAGLTAANGGRAALKPRLRGPLAVAVLVLLTALTAGIMYRTQMGGGRVSPLSAIKPAKPEHTISYWGELQKYSGDRPIGTPTRLTGGIAGETYFSTGDGLRFFFAASDPGYLYLIDEEPGSGTDPGGYRILFPSPAANRGSANLVAHQPVATSENVFDEQTGTDKVWIIWSVNPVPELGPAVQRWVNQRDEGQIKDPEQAARVSNFIDRHRVVKPQVEPDQANGQIRLRGSGEVLIHSLSLEHR